MPLSSQTAEEERKGSRAGSILSLTAKDGKDAEKSASSAKQRAGPRQRQFSRCLGSRVPCDQRAGVHARALGSQAGCCHQGQRAATSH